ncbi:MAG: PEP/pyruvate-binding domain-containing protein [Planctomycetota bacterium]
MKYLLNFDDTMATRTEYAGGKGANLAILTRRGFPVPRGFIITAACYDEFVRGMKIPLNRLRGDSLDDESMELARREWYTAMDTAKLPGALDSLLRDNLAAYPPDQLFAVRSSSTMEDLSYAAFAGQHETFLGCRGIETVRARIRDCFRSLWSHRAVAYRQQRDLDHRRISMAVIIQEMVPCDTAGVAFSINPVTGNLNQIVVDANLGLGETVVGGEQDVDHYEIDKKSGRLCRSIIAHKMRKIVCTEDGTQDQPINAAQVDRPCLNEAMLSRIVDLLRKVENSFQFPQDIEWGFYQGKLLLLQSRPITAFAPRWTRDESAERFPGVITPLSWDLMEEGFQQSFRFSLELMGLPPFDGKWFDLHDHYVYGNQNLVEIYALRLPIYVTTLDDLRPLIPELRRKYAWVQELPTLWARDLDSFLINIGELMARPLDKLELNELWRFVGEVHQLGMDYFRPNIAISLTQGKLFHLLLVLLKIVVGDRESTRLFDDLLGFCVTKTGTINKELFEMARMIRARPDVLESLRDSDSRHLVATEFAKNIPGFHERFEKFLRDHGHREVDPDPYAPTWRDLPWVVLDNLRLVLRGPMETTPAERERELKIRMQKSELELLRCLPEDLHFFFHEVVRLARTYASLDDMEHYQTTRLTLPLRKGLHELGSRLVKRGILVEPADIFFAHRHAIESAIKQNTEAGWRVFSQEIVEEKQAYLYDRQRGPEWVLGEKTVAQAGEDVLSGIPGSAGCAEGPVFRVLSLDDFARFPQGSVLVTRTTNPTWTPLFYCAAAVITECGGPLSHGAVTAREMRIPAVMAVHDALDKLHDGDHVRVDGTHGRVHQLTQDGQDRL